MACGIWDFLVRARLACGGAMLLLCLVGGLLPSLGQPVPEAGHWMAAGIGFAAAFWMSGRAAGQEDS